MKVFWWGLLSLVLFIIAEGFLAQWRASSMGTLEGYIKVLAANGIWGWVFASLFFFALFSFGAWGYVAAWTQDKPLFLLMRVVGPIGLLPRSLFTLLPPLLGQSYQPVYEKLELEGSGSVMVAKVYLFPTKPVETVQLRQERISWIEYKTYHYRSENNPPKVELSFKRENGSLVYPNQRNLMDPKDADILAEKFNIPVERVEVERK